MKLSLFSLFFYLFESVAVVVVVIRPNPPSIVVLVPTRDVDRFVGKPPNEGSDV